MDEATYTHNRRLHWDTVARDLGTQQGWGECYHRRLEEIFQHLVLPGQRVMEIGCGCGDLLAALKPSFGVGIDFSGEMVHLAAARHPQLSFVQADAHAPGIRGTFDVIILSDLVNDLWDVQEVFQQLGSLSHAHTKLIINCYSRLWELPLAITERFGLARPTLYQNWLTVQDITHLLRLTDFGVIRHSSEILFPLAVPGLEQICNRFLVKLWPFSVFALTNIIVAKPIRASGYRDADASVSVVVPTRNEAGNIRDIIERVPAMGSEVELIFVEGGSTDDTYATIEQMIEAFPDRRCRVFKQKGKGKGDAVRLGFAEARGDVLMILDADLTVPPEDLPRFFDALVSGRGEFINGVRLIYPMEDRAMRFVNLVGNKLFSLCFSWLLGQSVKDTLCGTKVLWASHYRLIAANRSYFGSLDPFGDFDLILGAARLNLAILDLPVRYRERVYGTTNIKRWQHGWLLLKMAAVAAFRIKFI